MKSIPASSGPLPYPDAVPSGSGFVEIKTGSVFEVRMQYPLRGMKNAVEKCLVRKEVYLRLLQAHKALPPGFRFLIYDAWRPFELQKELYEKYAGEILARFGCETADEAERERTVGRFVSAPARDRDLPPVHTTGGAVDLSIVDAAGRELDMGCGFDVFDDCAHTAFFEKTDRTTVINNRRLLYWAMIGAGFTNLPSEWWHYDYGDRFWGFYKRTPALYKGVFSSEEIALTEGV